MASTFKGNQVKKKKKKTMFHILLFWAGYIELHESDSNQNSKPKKKKENLEIIQ